MGLIQPKEKIINDREKNENLKYFLLGRPTLSKGIQYLIQSLQKLIFHGR